MTSSADSRGSSLYGLIEDFVVALLVAGALASLQVIIDASPRVVLATALGGPGVYFLGQRIRRMRSTRQPGAGGRR
jgi:hypothetical protein